MEFSSRIRIHITGAAGSGTTTLGGALAERFRCDHFDTDDYQWYLTNPPYQQMRPVEERLEMLRGCLGTSNGWILSGSLNEWGDPLIPLFDLIVFLAVPHEVRMRRLREREVKRYGDDIRPGGIMHKQHLEFLAWAAAYETAGMEMRSRVRHEKWLASLPCPVIRFEGEMATEDQVLAIGEEFGSRR